MIMCEGQTARARSRPPAVFCDDVDNGSTREVRRPQRRDRIPLKRQPGAESRRAGTDTLRRVPYFASPGDRAEPPGRAVHGAERRPRRDALRRGGPLSRPADRRRRTRQIRQISLRGREQVFHTEGPGAARGEAPPSDPPARPRSPSTPKTGYRLAIRRVLRSPLPVLRGHAVSCRRDRVARERALGVVPLRRLVSPGEGRERIGRGVILERGPSPSAAVREPLAILHHFAYYHGARTHLSPYKDAPTASLPPTQVTINLFLPARLRALEGLVPPGKADSRRTRTPGLAISYQRLEPPDEHGVHPESRPRFWRRTELAPGPPGAPLPQQWRPCPT